MNFKKILINIIFTVIILLNLLSTYSLGFDTSSVSVSSPSAILIESKTGRILYDKNSNEKMYPASTTKVMTALLTLENISNLQEHATVSYNSVFSVPKGYSTDLLKVGEELSIEELLYALLVKSSNEAANVLAEHIAGSVESFATMMNTRASELNCKNTNFVNPNGIHDENHYSTAYDLALIAREAMKDDTFRKIVSTVSHTLPSSNKYERTDRNLINTNDLINKSNKNYYEYAIGIKTGYTSQAKNCLIAGAKKDDIELIAVVLGADKLNTNKLSVRDLDCKNLFNYVYDNFSEKTIINSNDIVSSINISNGTKETKNLDLISESSITTLITNDKLKIKENPEIMLNENIKAPISKGTIVGTVKYNIDGLEYTSNLIASHDVKKSSLFTIFFRLLLIILILYVIAKILNPRKVKRGKRKKGTKYVRSFK